MRISRLVRAWHDVRATRSRLGKTEAIAEVLDGADAASVRLAVSYLSGVLPQGRIGLGYAAVGSVAVEPALESSLTISDVDDTLTRIALASGSGSKATKSELVTSLLARATADEQDFLRRLLLGGLRQGALEAIMADAIAQAAGLDLGLVRRAAMLTGDLGAVAVDALQGGRAALARFGLELFTAVQPMLAQSAASVAEAMERTGRAGVEWKVDGARLQVHRQGDRVAVFTRNLRDITDAAPDVVRAVTDLDVASIILDGEAIGFGEDGRPIAFQDTMSRFASEGDGDLSCVFFDCLHLDGQDLIDLPGERRWQAMAAALPARLLIPRLVTDSVDEAQQFFDDAIAAGHEGVIVKSLTADYAAGRRGAEWIKVKPVHTLDLVVLAVEWGSGRRSGWLSNIHLGARDAGTGEFIMLGKTFKGMTDEMLAWQTERFLELETHRRGHVVHVRPEQVVEIAVDGVQGSSRYPGGVALRFARVKRYRDDRVAAEADTIDTVRSLF